MKRGIFYHFNSRQPTSALLVLFFSTAFLISAISHVQASSHDRPIFLPTDCERLIKALNHFTKKHSEARKQEAKACAPLVECKEKCRDKYEECRTQAANERARCRRACGRLSSASIECRRNCRSEFLAKRRTCGLRQAMCSMVCTQKYETDECLSARKSVLLWQSRVNQALRAYDRWCRSHFFDPDEHEIPDFWPNRYDRLPQKP